MLLEYEHFMFAYSMVLIEHVLSLTANECESKKSHHNKLVTLNCLLGSAGGGKSFLNKAYDLLNSNTMYIR